MTHPSGKTSGEDALMDCMDHPPWSSVEQCRTCDSLDRSLDNDGLRSGDQECGQREEDTENIAWKLTVQPRKRLGCQALASSQHSKALEMHFPTEPGLACPSHFVRVTDKDYYIII